MNRRTAIALSLFAPSLFLFVACSGVRVSTDYDPSVDFTGFGSYAWLDDSSGVEGDREDVTSLLDRRIRQAIEDELEAKGLARVERDEAEVLVSYHLSVDKKLDVDTINTGVGYYRGWYGASAHTETIVREYEEGTLLVDLVEPGSRQLVWRGSGQSRLRESSSPEQREQRVRQVVGAILKDYPPASGD